jgi:poly(3-hydroxybutyrate) depolymerase
MRWLLSLALLCPLLAQAAGKIHTVEYPPSSVEGELIYGVTYRLWVPEGMKKIRAVIVHQHGCGAGACKGGETAADDLHWQALAKKWDAVLLGPSYRQKDGEDCRKWCDPRNGSEKAFLRALADLAKQTGHEEIETAPWCLWGHSGGGFWSSLMQTMHPDRIAGIWLRSGTAFETWEKGDIPKPTIPEAAYHIPVMCNPGAKEKGDKKFNGAYTGTRAMFVEYRKHGAPIGFAPDPLTSHETGDSRYLAIPFFDTCLKMRFMEQDQKQVWLAPLEGDAAVPEAEFKGDKNTAVWLPNATIAKAWMEYVKTGGVSDTTPPPSPYNVRQITTFPRNNDLVLTWEADADFESGLQGFIIKADGMEIGRVPEKPVPKFGRPLFQRKTHGDTAEAPLAEMKIAIKNPPTGAKPPVFSVSSVNSVGLVSEPAELKP